MAPDANWTDELIARLRALWAEGHSAAEIGRRMGISKNAVVGKAHRLDLPARPSPIILKGAKRQPRMLPKLRAKGPLALLAEPVRPHVPRPAAFVATPPVARHACCWPFGDPGTPSFRFCGDPGLQGKPYCVEHCGLAYRPVVLKEIAAA